MTGATWITILRILLIPVFVTFAIYYAQSVAAGQPVEWLRYAAIAAFGTAAVSDLIDGWVARRFRQESRLGRILDPIADKLLMVAAVLTLAFSTWPAPLPLWFVVVLVSREVILLFGTFVVDHVAGRVEIEPHWTGKVATCLQVVTVSVSMLNLQAFVLGSAAAACFFTVVSAVLYMTEGTRQGMVQLNEREK
jgi:cardiolipin synthase (CMP-forming)